MLNLHPTTVVQQYQTHIRANAIAGAEAKEKRTERRKNTHSQRRKNVLSNPFTLGIRSENVRCERYRITHADHHSLVRFLTLPLIGQFLDVANFLK